MHWQRQKDNLLTEEGIRPLDNTLGRHADVVSAGDEAYIFYFTHPWCDYDKPEDYDGVQGRESACVVQCARLTCRNGILCCDRNENFDICLPPQGEIFSPVVQG